MSYTLSLQVIHGETALIDIKADDQYKQHNGQQRTDAANKQNGSVISS